MTKTHASKMPCATTANAIQGTTAVSSRFFDFSPTTQSAAWLHGQLSGFPHSPQFIGSSKAEASL
jgi:hypothetical protein